MSTVIRLGTTIVKGRVVQITLSENGPGYKRLNSPIQQSLKNAAADMVGKRVADGKVFGDESKQTVSVSPALLMQDSKRTHVV